MQILTDVLCITHDVQRMYSHLDNPHSEIISIQNSLNEAYIDTERIWTINFFNQIEPNTHFSVHVWKYLELWTVLARVTQLFALARKYCALSKPHLNFSEWEIIHNVFPIVFKWCAGSSGVVGFQVNEGTCGKSTSHRFFPSKYRFEDSGIKFPLKENFGIEKTVLVYFVEGIF